MSDMTHDPRDLAPAYVLGTLTPDEARAFEAALEEDPNLQREVREYRETGALLALAGGAAPPADLKARLLERIRDDKHVALVDRRPGRRPFAARFLPLGLAASVLIAAGLGLQVRDLRRQLGARDSILAVREGRLAARERTLNSILEPGVELTLLTTTGEQPPGIQVFRDRARNRAIIHAFRLPPAPAGRSYQLWLIPSQGDPIPSQVFNSEPDGHVLVENIDVPAGVTIVAYAVTQEPAAGSARPTLPILLIGRVAGS